ncbi:unknown protein [Seminavis robusta]|uniref:Uncharacterized protein n=1 Tax=Seminavis robusta TaxID=568900 RepID=A0A9N8HTD5_9STRA|nr:unknown protein [Seminavis robusta]|eukprot:Sro1264_g257310.1 n/a (473) ;mRNA; r:4389-5892
MPQRYENVEFSEDGAVGNLKLDRKGFAFLPNGGDETEDLRECKWDKIVEYAACGSSASSTEHKLRLVLRKVSKSKGTEKKKEILLAFESHDDLYKVEKDICGYMRRNSILQDDSLSGSLPFHLDRRSSHNSTSPFDLSFSSTTSTIPVSPSASRRMSNDFLRSSSSLPPVSPFSDTSSHSAALDDQPLPAAEKALYQSVTVGGKEGSLDMSQDGLLFYKKGKTKSRNKPKQIPFSAIQKLQVNTTAPKLKLTFKDEEDAVLFAFSGREDMEEVKKEIESHIHLESKKTDPLRPTSMADPKQSDPPQPSTNDGQIQKADDKESAIAHGLERGQAWRLQREASIEESKDLQERTEDIRSRPEMWSITYEQLLQLAEDVKLKFGKFKYKRATMRDVNRKILEPHCIKTGTSYALSLNPEGLLVDAFITHAWDEKFADFVEVRVFSWYQQKICALSHLFIPLRPLGSLFVSVSIPP